MSDPVIINIGNRIRLILILGIGMLVFSVIVTAIALYTLLTGKTIIGEGGGWSNVITLIAALLLLVLGISFVISYLRQDKGFLAIGSQGITLDSSQAVHIDWNEIAAIDVGVFSRRQGVSVQLLDHEDATSKILDELDVGAQTTGLDIRIMLSGIVPSFTNRQDMKSFRLPRSYLSYSHGIPIPINLHKSTDDMSVIVTVIESLQAYAGTKFLS